MKRKIAIVGATGGLGEEICLKFAQNGADMIFLGRNVDKMKKLADKIKSQNECNIDFVEVDLVDMDSVKIATDKLLDMEFDSIVLNAGVYNVPRFITKTGYENVFQINFVSQYYIAQKVFEKFKAQKSGNIVAVGSVAYNYSQTDLQDIDFRKRKKSSKVYGNSKRILMFSLYELFKDEKDVKLSIVHPGVTLTHMTNHYPKWINWVVKLGIKILFPSPKNACRSIVQGVDDGCGYFEWIGPRVFNVWGKPKKQKLKENKKEAEEIFNVVQKIYKSL